MKISRLDDNFDTLQMLPGFRKPSDHEVVV